MALLRGYIIKNSSRIREVIIFLYSLLLCVYYICSEPIEYEEVHFSSMCLVCVMILVGFLFSGGYFIPVFFYMLLFLMAFKGIR